MALRQGAGIVTCLGSMTPSPREGPKNEMG